MDVCLDIETSYEHGQAAGTVNHVTSVWLQWSDADRCVVRGIYDIELLWHKLATALENGKIDNLVMLNAQFDLSFMPARLRLAAYGKVRDLLILSKARGNEYRHSLKHLTALFLARPGSYAWLVPGQQHDYNNDAYGAEDIDCTWRLFKLWHKDLEKPVVEVMNRAVSMFVEQTINGSKIDVEQLDAIADSMLANAHQAHAELTAKYGCDPNQIEAFANRLVELGYKLTAKTKTGRDQLTDDVLDSVGLQDVLDYRQTNKLAGSLTKNIRALLRPDGTLPHTQKCMEAKTGRTSMSDYNWQQADRKGVQKSLLISRFPKQTLFNSETQQWEEVLGKIAAVDLAQAELRWACYLSDDDVMRQWLTMTDAHRFNASMAFNVPFEEVTDEQRSDAKIVVFRLCYGGRAITEGQKVVEAYLRSRFKKLFKWIDAQSKWGQNNPTVTDSWDKTTGLLETLDYAKKWACGRAAINYPVQGAASHCAIWITCRIWELFRERRLRSLVLMGIHDAIIMDVHPEEIEQVTECVKQAFLDMGAVLVLKYPMAKKLALQGSLQFADNWFATKKGTEILCSTLSK